MNVEFLANRQFVKQLAYIIIIKYDHVDEIYLKIEDIDSFTALS